jgi:hypothetical protein
MTITWTDRLANLRAALGRKPTLQEMLDVAQIHEMTPEEVEAQRRSWVRGMTTPCEHGELDFEQCGACRTARDPGQSARPDGETG